MKIKDKNNTELFMRGLTAIAGIVGICVLSHLLNNPYILWSLLLLAIVVHEV